ncbi:MAG: hypothetical protein FJ267_18290, partial [Planctomycetes bacterium]|nr:hypothetical protein [Planctomycetota bacterium]
MTLELSTDFRERLITRSDDGYFLNLISMSSLSPRRFQGNPLLNSIFASCLVVIIGVSHVHAEERDAENARKVEHFEKNVRPLLIEHCFECHGQEKQEGGLRLDQREAAFAGGQSGIAIKSMDAAGSLLLEAIKQTGDLKMPPAPKSKLSENQIASIEKWIKSGAVWPKSEADEPLSTKSPATTPRSFAQPISPDDATVAGSLQIWLKADVLNQDDGTAVAVWPDRSGHGREFLLTKGIRNDGSGEAPLFIRESQIRRRPAVRFSS